MELDFILIAEILLRTLICTVEILLLLIFLRVFVLNVCDQLINLFCLLLLTFVTVKKIVSPRRLHYTAIASEDVFIVLGSSWGLALLSYLICLCISIIIIPQTITVIDIFTFHAFFNVLTKSLCVILSGRAKSNKNFCSFFLSNLLSTIDWLIDLLFTACIVHVLHFKHGKIFGATCEESESFCTFSSDNFKYFNPHFSREIHSKCNRRGKYHYENEPAHQLTLHYWLTFASLVVQAEVDGYDYDTQG